MLSSHDLALKSRSACPGVAKSTEMLFEIQLTFRQIDWINGQNVLNGEKTGFLQYTLYIPVHLILDYNSIIRHKFEEMGTFGTFGISLFSVQCSRRINN